MFAHQLHPYSKALLSAIPVPELSARKKKAHVIRGEVTSPIDPKPGCRFAARCEFATDACTGKDPEFREVAPGHFVACPFAEKLNQ